MCQPQFHTILRCGNLNGASHPVTTSCLPWRASWPMFETIFVRLGMINSWWCSICCRFTHEMEGKPAQRNSSRIRYVRRRNVVSLCSLQKEIRRAVFHLTCWLIVCIYPTDQMMDTSFLQYCYLSQILTSVAVPTSLSGWAGQGRYRWMPSA
jgi:hypothetical protein